MNEITTVPPLPRLQGEEHLPEELPLPPGMRGRLVWLFRVPNLPNPRRKRDLVKWWESRRLAYNILIPGIGFVSYLIFLALNWVALKSDPTFEVSPIAMITMPVVIIIGMNICYTAGWLVEVCLAVLGVRDRRLGPFLLKAGIVFSLIFDVAPTLFMIVMLALKAVHPSLHF